MSATTVSMSNCRRPQVGQAISTGPRSRSLSAFRISQATLTSSSAWKVESEIRIVSPMPSASSVPRPTADFSEPDHFVPASVIPRCSGYGMRSDSRRLAAIVFGTLVDLIETLKSRKSRRSISATNSVPAVTSASTAFSRSSACRCLGSEPELTPMRIGVPGGLRAVGDLGDLLGPADVARVEADAVRPGVDRLQRQRVVEVDVGDDRDRRLDHDRLERLDVLVARHGDAHDVRARLGHGADLLHRGREVRGLGLGHRLDGDRRASADLNPAHRHVSLGGHMALSLEARRLADPEGRRGRAPAVDVQAQPVAPRAPGGRGTPAPALRRRGGSAGGATTRRPRTRRSRRPDSRAGALARSCTRHRPRRRRTRIAVSRARAAIEARAAAPRPGPRPPSPSRWPGSTSARARRWPRR